MWPSDLCGLRKRLGCRRSGRHGDTIRLGRCAWWPVGHNTLVGLLYCWDAPAMPRSVGGDMSCTRVQDGTARDALRYHAVGLVRAGLPKVGTFRRHQTVHCACALGIVRGVDFITSGVPLPAKHAAQLGSTTCGSRRSRCGVKGHCGVCGLQGRRGSWSPAAQCINGRARGTGRHCEEAGGGCQGSPGDNAPQAIITCIEAAMRSSSYANGVMVDQRAKFQGLTAKLGPLDVTDSVGTGLMGGGTREGHGCHRQDLCSQRGAEVQVSKWWWVGHIASVCLHKCADRHRTVSLSKLKVSLVGHTWSSILSLLSKLRCACQLPLWCPQFGRV